MSTGEINRTRYDYYGIELIKLIFSLLPKLLKIDMRHIVMDSGNQCGTI